MWSTPCWSATIKGIDELCEKFAQGYQERQEQLDAAPVKAVGVDFSTPVKQKKEEQMKTSRKIAASSMEERAKKEGACFPLHWEVLPTRQMRLLLRQWIRRMTRPASQMRLVQKMARAQKNDGWRSAEAGLMLATCSLGLCCLQQCQ